MRVTVFLRHMHVSWMIIRGVGYLCWDAKRGHGIARRWIHMPYGKVYLRIALRYLEARPDQWTLVLELASIEIEEKYQRQGLFGRILTVLEGQAKRRNFEAVIVENVLTDKLRDYLIRQNYQPMLSDPLSVYKVVG